MCDTIDTFESSLVLLDRPESAPRERQCSEIPTDLENVEDRRQNEADRSQLQPRTAVEIRSVSVFTPDALSAKVI